MAARTYTTTASLPTDHRSPSPDWLDTPLSSAGLTVVLAVVALLAVTYPLPTAAFATGWVLQRLLRH
ncbi:MULTISPECIES: hypothetical protein [Salinibaculum]|uniref:hypothetical protein n=1 Tax=Salinibaculum TaxID=2732368 RepID=UPI0030D4C6BA